MNKNEKIVLEEQVERALDSVRPHLAVDGGNVELVEVTPEKWVKIKWLGTCVNCNMSVMTMKAGIESAIKASVPDIVGVEAINGIEIES
jgi:Fe-S cluster biogenesis protein NfuA